MREAHHRAGRGRGGRGGGGEGGGAGGGGAGGGGAGGVTECSAGLGWCTAFTKCSDVDSFLNLPKEYNK